MGGWYSLRAADIGAPHLRRRVFGFARPYRTQLALFLFVIVVDSLIGVATPVLAGRVVNDITRRAAVHTVIEIALVITALAVIDAALSFAQRWYSARIGEGLIYDMRTEVFDQRIRKLRKQYARRQGLLARLDKAGL